MSPALSPPNCRRSEEEASYDRSDILRNERNWAAAAHASALLNLLIPGTGGIRRDYRCAVMILTLFLGIVTGLVGMVYSLYGAYRVYQGQDFLYPWIGTRVKRRRKPELISRPDHLLSR